MAIIYVKVLLSIPINYSLTYSFDEDSVNILNTKSDNIKFSVVGKIVLVPLGKKEILGIIVSIEKNTEILLNIQIKEIKQIINLPSVSSSFLKFILWVSQYNMIPVGQVAKMVISYRNISFLKKISFKEFSNEFFQQNTLKQAKKCSIKEYHKESDKQKNQENYQLNRCNTIILTKDQEQVALNILNKSFDFTKTNIIKMNDNITVNQPSVKFNVSLIQGITGSGKTEVYTYIAQKIIEQGGQVLILLPEILLTDQLSQRFNKYLGAVNIWHSQITQVQRRKIWLGVQGLLNEKKSNKTTNKNKKNKEIDTKHYNLDSGIQFVVGARSAIFLPFQNLRLIIIDEEHDSSFKQDEGPIYHARDMAIIRANVEKIPIILSSATPSVESMYNVQLGKYDLYELKKRYSGVSLPKVEVLQVSNKTILHERSITLLKHTLECGEQSLLFVNRRGYAPISMCKFCQLKSKCPSCSFHLVYHKNSNKLRCHYCTYSKLYSQICNQCGNKNDLFIGIGAEKVEEEINKNILPKARTLVVTSDTISNRTKSNEVLLKILNREVDIIIGTQMLAKGLHFQKLQLVIVVDSDSNHMNGDIRAIEKTYQLLHQVIGRAGREEKQGKVVIQTNDSFNPVLKAVLEENSEKFYETEIYNRKQAFMPPFSKIANILIYSSNEDEINKWLHNVMVAQIPKYDAKHLNIMGPAQAPIYKIRKYYRYRFIVRSSRHSILQKFIQEWLQAIEIPRSFKLKVDIDPYNFL